MTSGSETSAFSDFEHAGWQRLAGGYNTYFKQLVVQTIDPLLSATRPLLWARICRRPGASPWRRTDRARLFWRDDRACHATLP